MAQRQLATALEVVAGLVGLGLILYAFFAYPNPSVYQNCIPSSSQATGACIGAVSVITPFYVLLYIGLGLALVALATFVLVNLKPFSPKQAQ
jgi:hypothetical protein